MGGLTLIQIPERSGLPSADRGAGAARLGSPSRNLGVPGSRTEIHCAIAGTAAMQTASVRKIVSRLVVFMALS